MTAAELTTLAGIGLLLCCSALFSASETALTSITRTAARAMRKSGDARDRKVVSILDNLGKTVTGLLIGNNVVNIGMASLATALGLEGSDSDALAIVALTTVAILVFGEILPKTIAAHRPRETAKALLPFIGAALVATAPVAFAFTGVNAAVSSLLRRVGRAGKTRLTEDELRLVMDAGKRDGALCESEHRLLERAFSFTARTVREIMTPRTSMVAIEASSSVEEAEAVFAASGFSRIPVYEETRDNVVGMIHFKDILFREGPREGIVARDIARKPAYVPESMTAGDLIEELKRGGHNLAIVLDERGGTAGLVTMDDAIASIIGSIRDEFDSDGERPADRVQILGKNRVRIPGNLKLGELNALLKTNFDSRYYETVGGYIMEQAGRIPEKGECVRQGPAVFTVIDRTPRAINRIDINLG